MAKKREDGYSTWQLGNSSMFSVSMIQFDCILSQ